MVDQNIDIPTYKKPKVITDQLLDIGIVSNINEEDSYEKLNKLIFKKRGCSISVMGEGDNLIVGRNQDFLLSEDALFKMILHTNKYKVICFSYPLGLKGYKYEDIKANGLSEDNYKLVPFCATDCLNEEGLYVSGNIRYEEYDVNGNPINVCSGTNPSAKQNINLFSIAPYLTSRCADVPEALEAVKNINIFSPLYYNMTSSMTLVDAKGNYGVLEFARNKFIWLDKQRIQTNFFIAEEFKYNDSDKKIPERYGVGYGRFDLLQKGFEGEKTPENVLKFMEQLYFCETLADEPKYDIRSEYCTNIPISPDGQLVLKDDGSLDLSNIMNLMHSTSKFMMDDNNKSIVMEGIKKYNSQNFIGKTREELKKLQNCMTTISSFAIDCKNKKIYAHFWENKEKTFYFGFE